MLVEFNAVDYIQMVIVIRGEECFIGWYYYFI